MSCRRFNCSHWLAIFAILALCLTSKDCLSQHIDGETIPELYNRLARCKNDQQRLPLWLALGKRYLLKIGTVKSDIDSARYYSVYCKARAQQLGLDSLASESDILLLKTYLEIDDQRAAAAMLHDPLSSVTDIKILLLIGENYMYRHGVGKKDYDSTWYMFSEALRLSRKLKDRRWEAEALRFQGKFFFELRDLQRGRELFEQAITLVTSTGNKYLQGIFWIDYGYNIADDDNTFDEKARYISRSVELFHQAGMPDKEIWAVRARAEVYRRQGRLDTAAAELLRAVEMQKKAGYRNFHESYQPLTEIYMFKGEYDNALMYALNAVKSMEQTTDTTYAAYMYERLGDIYSELGEPANSVTWYQRAADAFDRAGDREPVIRIKCHAALELLGLQRPKEALELLLRARSAYKPLIPVQRQIFARATGECYQALKQYRMAAVHFHEMMELEHELHLGNQISAGAYYAFGRYNFETGALQKAAAYLDTALHFSPGRVPLAHLKDIRLMLFKIDSMDGNYTAAIDHLKEYQQIKDRIFNDKKIRQFNELMLRYETEKNKKDIVNLQNLASHQRLELKQASQIRQFILITSLLLLLLLILAHSRYRIKRRNNLILKAKQEEISLQNQSLEKMIKEKDWLVREVHHRVKNNLQIIISLLETQYGYLEHEHAIKAIRESTGRMQAISLLHQKLYQPGSSASIDMEIYARELVSYLRESYGCDALIQPAIQVLSVRLDISQAVAVGMIVHEAVSNAIKYALPGNSCCHIRISLKETKGDMVQLIIWDNGPGLPQGIDFDTSSSLGFRLIRTFTEQLEGTLDISNESGLKLSIRFQKTR